jgi:hypothetical protein
VVGFWRTVLRVREARRARPDERWRLKLGREGSFRYEDTNGATGVLLAGGVEWLLGNYSVHTSPAALRAGEQRLNEIQHRLRNEGRL